MEKIFNSLATSILKLIPNLEFQSITLNIKRLEKNLGVQGFYINSHGDRKSLEVWDLDFDVNLIHELYKLSQLPPLKHINWNRAIFKIYPDYKFNIEYIWDQELHDEVEKYNSKS